MSKKKFTFVLPCLNDGKSLPSMVKEIEDVTRDSHWQAEILVVDNGSTDDSVEIANNLNLEVVKQDVKGYGSALSKGILSSKNELVVFADCDGSYELKNVPQMLDLLNDEVKFVSGERRSIDQGAQPLLHRYLGVPALSLYGNLLHAGSNNRVKDWHCGLRAVNRDYFESLNVDAPGMEFSSQMLIKAMQKKDPIKVVPIRLRRDLREGKRSHLNTFSDGMRHLKLITKEKFGK